MIRVICNRRALIGALSTFTIGMIIMLALIVPTASAAEPEWRLHTLAPDTVTDNKPVTFYAWIDNVGETALSGELIVHHTFPVGIPAVDPEIDGSEGYGFASSCQIIGQEDVCEIDVNGLATGAEVRLKYKAFVSGASGLLHDAFAAEGGGMSLPQVTEEPIVVGAPGPFGVETFSMSAEALDGAPAEQAGSTPRELANTLVFSTLAVDPFGTASESLTAPSEHLRDTVVHIPAGLIGNPNATPVRCFNAQLAEPSPQSGGQKTPNCPQDSQVGVARIVSYIGPDIVPVYSLIPPPGSPAAFGFTYEGLTVVLAAKIRPGDYGVDLEARRASSSIPLPEVDLTVWGSPADPSHDRLRHLCMDGWRGNNMSRGEGGICRAGYAPVPFLRLPTSCSNGSLPWAVEIDTYERPGTFVSKEATTPATKDCADDPFDPAISLTPTDSAAGGPTGLEARVTMPQERTPEGLAEADIKRAEVTLPRGMSVNPAVATGLQSCSDRQLRLGLEGPAECPEPSKIGTLEVRSPLLDHPIGGSVFVRSQGSDTPQSGGLYRLAIEIRSDQDGVDVKLPGKLQADPSTGDLTAVFEDLPQLPIESLGMKLKDGQRAPLIAPPSCGMQTALARFTGWNGTEVIRKADFSISGDGHGSSCPARAFNPVFTAGTENHLAGRTSPFSMRITRGDTEQELADLTTQLPPGLAGYLKGIPYCSDAALAGIPGDPGTGTTQEASPSCPAASRVGAVTVGAGAGTNPFYTSAGRAYLAGPYKGAPLSLAVVVPAVAGPFDLGSVVVRNAIRVDPTTARLRVMSDPLPTVLHGIRLDLRDVRIEIDRNHFIVNPTNCEPMSIGAMFSSTVGAIARGSERFQAAGCAELGFKPRVSLRFFGPTHRAAHPRLRAVLRPRGRDANIGKTNVLLPKSELLENAHIRTICTRIQFNSGGGGGAACPKGSVYGYAKAWSPLLDQPLQGPVYLRSNGGERELPDLVAALEGQIHIDLVGYIDSVKARIRTRFVTVPDAPVSKFVLTMQGGKKGLLANNTNLCSGSHHAVVQMVGQNGRVLRITPPVKAGCRRS